MANIVSGIPQTPVRLYDSIERELTKAVLIMVLLYYSKSIQLKINKSEKQIKKSPGQTRHKLPVFLPRGVV